MIDTLILDIETTSLDADAGAILCASYESSTKPGKVVTLRNDKVNADKWRKGIRGDDKELVKQINAQVRNHDVIVAHNGNRFDLPYLRTRALHWNLEPLRDVKMIDPCLIAYRKFKLKSNSLGRIADYVGVVDRKTPLDMSVWMDAALNGSTSAMDLIVEHCEADIRVLSAVLKVVKPFVKILDERGSAL